MDIRTLSKKELKEYVNNNGSFINMKLNFVDLDENKRGTPVEHKENMPAGSTYFEAVASTGELNRNGYIIRPEAWKGSIKNFLENGVILYQHDTEKPIGRPLNAEVTDKGELKVAGYIFDPNNYSEGNILNGNVTGISTGHISEAVEFENEDTGEILSEDQFLKEHEYVDMGWFGTYITPGRVLAVTEADRLEFSFVTLPSNKKSRVKYINGIEEYLTNKGYQCKIGDKECMAKNLLKQGVEDLKAMLNNPTLSDNAKAVIQAKINEVEGTVEPKEEVKEEPVIETPADEATPVGETDVEVPAEEVVEEKKEEEPVVETPTEETPEVVAETPTEETKEEVPADENKKEVNPVDPCEGLEGEEKDTCMAEQEKKKEEENDCGKPEGCSGDCNDCPADCEDNLTKKVSTNDIEETPAPVETPTEETPKEETPTDEEVKAEEAGENEDKEEETPATTDEEAPTPETIPETDGGDAVATPAGEEQVKDNSVEINTIQGKLNETTGLLETATAENALLKTKNDDLTKQLNEKDELLEQGAKAIEKLSALVERAKQFSKEQGLNFVGEKPKTILENRMKIIR